jgi:acyl-CoA-binding protein
MNLNDDFEEIFSKQGNTLLDETFNEASSYVRKKTSEISKENLLYLYGRYKYACEGACDSDRPGGLFNLEAKTKWDSWKALGSTLTKDKAKEDYISKLTDLFPNWKDEGKSQADQFSNAGKAGTFGVKASTMAKELVNEADRNCFDLCREGSVQKLSEYLNKNPKLINQVDENKMTMAMWACKYEIFFLIKIKIRTKLLKIKKQNQIFLQRFKII